MNIYLVVGTCELFRHQYAVPSGEDSDGNELVAVRGVLASLVYKPAQVFRASGWRTFTTVWPVIEFEADDALPSELPLPLGTKA